MTTTVFTSAPIFLFITIKLFFFCGFFASKQWDYLLALNLVEAIIWILLFRFKYVDYNIFIPLVLLPAANLVYTNVPLALIEAGLDIFPFSAELVWKSLLMQSLMSSHLWLFIYLFFSREQVTVLMIRLRDWSHNVVASTMGMTIMTIVGALISMLYIANFYTSGASDLVGTAARGELNKTVETGKVWLMHYAFCSWLIAFVLLVMSRAAKAAIHWSHMLIGALATGAFFFAYLSIGNRRELMIVIMFFTLIAFARGRGLPVLLAVFLAVPFILFKGVSRSLAGQDVAVVDQMTLYLNLFGEFVFPHFPLLYQMEKKSDLLFGLSYLHLPGYMIPTLGLWPKTESLAVIFQRNFANMEMGYGYTPLAEGYQNFGFLSIILVPALIVLTLRLLTRVRLGFPVVILVALSFPLDINRGEFISVAFQCIIFSTFILLSLAVARFRMCDTCISH